MNKIVTKDLHLNKKLLLRSRRYGFCAVCRKRVLIIAYDRAVPVMKMFGKDATDPNIHSLLHFAHNSRGEVRVCERSMNKLNATANRFVTISPLNAKKAANESKTQSNYRIQPHQDHFEQCKAAVL